MRSQLAPIILVCILLSLNNCPFRFGVQGGARITRSSPAYHSTYATEQAADRFTRFIAIRSHCRGVLLFVAWFGIGGGSYGFLADTECGRSWLDQSSSSQLAMRDLRAAAISAIHTFIRVPFLDGSRPGTGSSLNPAVARVDDELGWP